MLLKELTEEKEVVGAVDIGGTKILVGIATKDGRVIESCSFKTVVGGKGATSGERSADGIISEIKRMTKAHNVTLARVGIGCAGPVDPVLGTVENPYTLMGWDRFNIVSYIKERLNVSVQLDNDVNTALLGEVSYKGLQGKSVLMVTFGTGIGVSFYDGERLYRTKGRFHPEMGHQIVDISGERCYCGRIGCFEGLCSGSMVNKRSKALGYSGFDEVMDVYNGGSNEAVNGFVSELSRQFKNGIWNLLTLFKPQVLILGGGLAINHFEFLSGLITDEFNNASDFVGEFTVLSALDDAGSALIGSVMLSNEIE